MTLSYLAPDKVFTLADYFSAEHAGRMPNEEDWVDTKLGCELRVLGNNYCIKEKALFVLDTWLANAKGSDRKWWDDYKFIDPEGEYVEFLVWAERHPDLSSYFCPLVEDNNDLSAFLIK